MNNVKKYKKKPVEIEAIQLNFNTLNECIEFCNGEINGTTGEFQIKTLEGVMTAKIGDYIIKGVAGEFYPCDKDIFHKSYEMGAKKVNESDSLSKIEEQAKKVYNLPIDSQPFNPYQNIGPGHPGNKFWYGYDPYKKEDGCPSNPKMTTVDRVKCGTNPQKGMEPDVNFKDEVDRGYKNNEYPLSPNECFQKKEKHFEGKVEPMKYDTKISKKDFEELISFFLK